jgi:hypothetical protein
MGLVAEAFSANGGSSLEPKILMMRLVQLPRQSDCDGLMLARISGENLLTPSKAGN